MQKSAFLCYESAPSEQWQMHVNNEYDFIWQSPVSSRGCGDTLQQLHQSFERFHIDGFMQKRPVRLFLLSDTYWTHIELEHG